MVCFKKGRQSDKGMGAKETDEHVEVAEPKLKRKRVKPMITFIEMLDVSIQNIGGRMDICKQTSNL